MIRKIIRQMLVAQVFSALTVSLCLLIDNIVIGRYLGEEAMAAYSFANPLLLIIGALGSLLAAGIQVACGKSLGKGSREETNAGFSSAIAITAVVSVVFLLVVILFRSPMARLLGAGQNGSLHDATSDYLAGFSIGAPGSMGALVLIPFLQMGGQGGLLIVAVLCMTVTDIALDLVSVLVIKNGMFGIGLASSLSYYVAMVIAATYFLSRKCAFRFSLKQVTGRKIMELIRGGTPSGFNMASAVILVFAMNQILKGSAGSSAVAAFTVVNSLGGAANCITTGTGSVSLTMSGILFNEEDRNGLRELLKLLCRYSVFLGLVMGTVLLIFSPFFVSLFLPTADTAQQMAILGLRLFAAGMIPCCINNALKYLYQATGRVVLTEIISVAEGALFPSLVALLLSSIFGVTGAWFYFALGEWLTLGAIVLMVFFRNGNSLRKKDAFMLLRDDFGVAEEDLMESEIRSIQEVVSVAEQAEQFCLQHGQNPRIASHIALCIEEKTSNTIQYGFTEDRNEHHLFVRILFKKDYWVLRFRDDCGAFDPVSYASDAGEEALGIRLILAMAQTANYTYSMNLNNLMLRLPSETDKPNE